MTSRMCLHRYAGLLVLLVGLARADLAPVETAEARIAVARQRVADALASSGLKVSADQVEFLSAVSAAGRSSALRMVSVTNRGADTLRVKLRCRDNRQCLPFYVLVHNPPQTGASGNAPSRSASSDAALPGDTPLQPLIRDGDPATLVLEYADYRISMPVLCLQGGARGQRIRVMSKDHKRFYEAEIVGAGIVRGRL